MRKVGRQLGDFVQKATGSTKGQRALVDVQAPLVERRRAAWNGSPPASACSIELPLVLVVQDVPEGGRTIRSAGPAVTWITDQEPGDVFNVGGLPSAGEYLSPSGAHGQQARNIKGQT